MTPQEVIQYAQDSKAGMADLKFMDFPGLWQHFTVPIQELSEEAFEDGFGFDGSSIRGWQSIHTSDMLVIPDPTSAVMDPFTQIPTLSLICNIVDPITKEKYTRDPRNIAQKAEAYMKFTGIADAAYFGPEAEFFIFDEIRFDSREQESFYFIDSVEGRWNSGKEESPRNLGYKPRYKEGYFPVPPSDSFQDLRSEMIAVMMGVGVDIECHHHEVATAGQAEIDMRFATLVKTADNLMWYKYIAKNVAKLHGKTVTFMPKPIWNDNGSGMHTHQYRNNGNDKAGDGGFAESGLKYCNVIRNCIRSVLALPLFLQ